MKNLPDKRELDIMWTVATSSSIETGKRPHYGFADLLYDYLINVEPPMKLADDDIYKKISDTLQESESIWNEDT
jgi:hypothetical protein